MFCTCRSGPEIFPPSALISFPFFQLSEEESEDLKRGRPQDGRKLSPQMVMEKATELGKASLKYNVSES